MRELIAAECKHCGEVIEDHGSGFVHATGEYQVGKHTCGIDPYGFHAEPVGTPCGDNPANPCNGSRGIEPKLT
ncbi:hypothetical protein A5721_16370 [Mycobacterium vulneris]|nr:hypothetical protein A5721_16370 [Mycolicibacterium vulneris]